jgi:hypothetical protein
MNNSNKIAFYCHFQQYFNSKVQVNLLFEITREPEDILLITDKLYHIKLSKVQLTTDMSQTHT